MPDLPKAATARSFQFDFPPKLSRGLQADPPGVRGRKHLRIGHRRSPARVMCAKIVAGGSGREGSVERGGGVREVGGE